MIGGEHHQRLAARLVLQRREEPAQETVAVGDLRIVESGEVRDVGGRVAQRDLAEEDAMQVAAAEGARALDLEGRAAVDHFGVVVGVVWIEVVHVEEERPLAEVREAASAALAPSADPHGPSPGRRPGSRAGRRCRSRWRSRGCGRGSDCRRRPPSRSRASAAPWRGWGQPAAARRRQGRSTPARRASGWRAARSSRGSSTAPARTPPPPRPHARRAGTARWDWSPVASRRASGGRHAGCRPPPARCWADGGSLSTRRGPTPLRRRRTPPRSGRRQQASAGVASAAPWRGTRGWSGPGVQRGIAGVGHPRILPPRPACRPAQKRSPSPIV